MFQPPRRNNILPQIHHQEYFFSKRGAGIGGGGVGDSRFGVGDSMSEGVGGGGFGCDCGGRICNGDGGVDSGGSAVSDSRGVGDNGIGGFRKLRGCRLAY